MRPVVCSLRCIGVLFLFFALPISAQSPTLLVPGRWEITLQNELPYAAQPVTYNVCIDASAARPEPPKGKPSDPCQIVTGGVAGNVLSYRSRCGNPFIGRLIAEKQEFLRSVSESSARELRDEEEVLEREACNRDVSSELGQVVLVGLSDLLDDPVQTKALEQARDL